MARYETQVGIMVRGSSGTDAVSSAASIGNPLQSFWNQSLAPTAKNGCEPGCSSTPVCRCFALPEWVTDSIAKAFAIAGLTWECMGKQHSISFVELTGKWVTVYGQQEVVKDLIARRLADRGDLRFECGDVSLDGVRRQEASASGERIAIHFDEI